MDTRVSKAFLPLGRRMATALKMILVGEDLRALYVELDEGETEVIGLESIFMRDSKTTLVPRNSMGRKTHHAERTASDAGGDGKGGD